MDEPSPIRTPTPLFRLLVVLSATTGMVDAASILGMDKVFTANMTGNVVFLAFAVVGTPGFRPWPYLVALAAFLAGAAIAGRIDRFRETGRLAQWLVLAAAIECLLLALAGTVALAPVERSHAGPPGTVGVIALTAGAMGFRNAVVRQLKVPDLTTTVLTLTLTGLASDSPRAAGGGASLWRRVSAVAGIFVGAAVGAVLVRQFGLGATLLITAGVVLAGTAVFVRHPQMTDLPRP